MTLITDEILSAYLDGELDADGAAMVDHELARSPALARRLGAMQAIEAKLGPAFAGVMAERTPDRFEALLSPGARGASAPGKVIGRTFAALLRPIVVGPAFASLAAGVIAGALLTPQVQPGFDFAKTGQIHVLGALADAISVAPSGIPTHVSNGELLVRLSFRDGGGRYCRHVSLAAQDMVVCNTAEGWVVEAMTPNASGISKGYQEAANSAPAEIVLALGRLGAASALDAESERSLISRNWTHK